jgi:hypothetical protein
MEQGDEKGSSELIRLGQLLGNPFFRKAFSNNPGGALAQEGLKRESIHSDVLETLADLSHEELRALSRLKEIMKKSGASPDERLEMV